MNQQRVLDVQNAKNGIDQAQSVNKSFFAFAKKNAVPHDIPTKIEFDGDRIKINIFGHSAEASPRIVKNQKGEFLVEYVLNVSIAEDHKIEAWRFYVTANGLIVEGAEYEQSLCDFNNEYVARFLCSGAILGALKSDLFAPAAKNG